MHKRENDDPADSNEVANHKLYPEKISRDISWVLTFATAAHKHEYR